MCVSVSVFCGALINTEPMVAGGSSSAAAVATDKSHNLSPGNTYTAEAPTKHTHTHSHDFRGQRGVISVSQLEARHLEGRPRGLWELLTEQWLWRLKGGEKKVWNKPEGKVIDETGRTGGWGSYTTISQNSHMDTFQLVRRRFGPICCCRERQVLMPKDLACKQCEYRHS